MHELLELKGQLESKKRTGIPGPSQLPKPSVVSADKIKKLITELREIDIYWSQDKYISSALITVYYNKIVAKSNRIKKLFSQRSNDNPNDYIVGARFEKNKHVITYQLNRSSIGYIIDKLILLLNILNDEFDSKIDNFTLDKVNRDEINVSKYGITKSSFAAMIVDVYYIERFSIDKNEKDQGIGDIIVTFYDLKGELEAALSNFGISYLNLQKIDNTTYLLSREQYDTIIEHVPYLVAMALTDINNITAETIGEVNSKEIGSFPKPTNEPIIGVIDTLFDSNVYFKDWVTFNNEYVSPELVEEDDYIHGTEVSGLIVNGPIMNPKLDDGCGLFRVRHFGVAKNSKMSSYDIVKNIEKIVKANSDIIVWNLSIGSEREINENFISFEGAILDELQSKYGVIFVVAGTNKTSTCNSNRIGAPADSINALVVNSSNLEGQSATYSRRGPVLSFFNKPDVCYFGGDGAEYIRVCNHLGEAYRKGTSFAAPWISRKLGYLIHKLGIPKEIAKALLIDAATSWNSVPEDPTVMGYGVVPQRIEDIITTAKDEIKFYIYGVAEKYDTFTYKIPIPISKQKQPFIAKATMCYFPHCTRGQGVDYTDVELDLHFGKIRQTKKGIEINCINDNRQGIPEMYGGNEEQARKEYRKWDNVKHICEKEKTRKIAKDLYKEGLWGLSIKKVDRLTTQNLQKIPFGVVITIKDIFGDDHFEEFIQQCNLRGWIVNRINVEEKLGLYNKIEEDITWE